MSNARQTQIPEGYHVDWDGYNWCMIRNNDGVQVSRSNITPYGLTDPETGAKVTRLA